MSALFLNGWQKIHKPDFIQTPSFGIQATYKTNKAVTFNYSNFIGTDKPDSVNAFRHFHNFYIQYGAAKKFGIIAGFDIGSEKVGINNVSLWYSPVIIVRQTINNKSSLALRGEYYHDKEQIIITTGTINGFQTLGISLNLDYDISDNVRMRVEGKMYNSKDKIFLNNNNSNYSITSNLTIKL